MGVEDDILAVLKDLRTIAQAEYNYDQTRYLATKVRAGQAILDKIWLYTPLGAGATTTLVFPNPAGFIGIAHFVQLRVSQSGVIELTLMKDDALEPWLYVPRTVDADLDITDLLPYDLVIRDQVSLTFTNHDAIAQWVVYGSIGSHVRKDIWEADEAEMNQMAQQFAMTGVPLP